MRHFITIIAVLTLLLCSCTGSNRRMLNQADTIMEQDADSALSILEKIDPNRLSKGDLSYYALLYTQAQVKTDIPLDSDSLISIAYRKYADDWWGDKGIRSNFYMGEVFFNQDNSRDAMKYYLTSYEESKRLDNDYWRAKSAERIADLFFYAFNYEEATKFRKDAIEYFGKAGRVTNQRYAVADLATEYMNDSKPEKALSMLDSLYRVSSSETEQDAYLLDYIKIGKVNTLVLLGNFDKLTSEDLRLIDDPRFNPKKIEPEILKLRIPNESVEVQEIIQYLKDTPLSAEDKARAYYACYRQIKSKQNPSLVSEIVDSLIFFQDALTHDIIKESVTSAERDFCLISSEKSQRKTKMTLTFSIILFLLVAIVVSIAWRFHRLKDIARKAELEANIEALVSLKANSERLTEEKSKEICDYKTQIQQLREKLEHETKQKGLIFNRLEYQNLMNDQKLEEIQMKHNAQNEKREIVLKHLFKEKWSTLSNLCEEYYEKGSSLKLRESIQRKIENEVRNIGSPDGLMQIEKETDRYRDGLVSKLRKECPFLKEKDIQFCCLQFAGFSARAICFILNISSTNFYVRKKRIIERINSSGCLDKSSFISNLA